MSKQSNVPARLFQVAEAIALVETEIAQRLDDEQEIPESVYERLAVYMEESAKNVDDVVRWIEYTKAQIEYLKQAEGEMREQRKRGEAALEMVKAHLMARLEAKAEALRAAGQPETRAMIEGNVSKLWVQPAGTASLSIFDETAIPADYFYRTITIHVPIGDEGEIQMANLTQMAENMDLEYQAMEEGRIRDDKRIRRDLEGGKGVPGAKLVHTRSLRNSKPRALKGADAVAA